MISIIYANRNRDALRIRLSLESLQKQSFRNFEVVFIDYGSRLELVMEYREVFKKFDFIRFYPLEVPQLLWNKSKALNYGFKIATTDFVFVADVDLIFHPETLSYFNTIADSNEFFLFPLNYLSQKESKKLEGNYSFSDLIPERRGDVNGMLLAPNAALHKVWGLDEFFHFYGAEDEDLFGRLENAGYKKNFCDRAYFLHNWHTSFSGSENHRLTSNPRIKNIMRINQQHFEWNMAEKLILPANQKSWGEFIPPEESKLLADPTKSIRIPNVLARVEHFLNEELTALNGEIISVAFFEDSYYRSKKYQVKKLLGKQTQPYCSMKEINDMVLKIILFNYRDRNYSFSISDDLMEIHFKIKL